MEYSSSYGSDGRDNSNNGVDYSNKCFFICPFGTEETKRRSDFVMDKIIRPALQGTSLLVERYDRVDDSRIIVDGVVNYIVDSPLLIADLTDRNPNVFYEIALRHGTGMPIIHIMHNQDASRNSIPFFINQFNALLYDYSDLGAEAFVHKLRQAIHNIMRDRFRSPLSGILSFTRGAQIDPISAYVLGVNDPVRYINESRKYSGKYICYKYAEWLKQEGSDKQIIAVPSEIIYDGRWSNIVSYPPKEGRWISSWIVRSGQEIFSVGSECDNKLSSSVCIYFDDPDTPAQIIYGYDITYLLNMPEIRFRANVLVRISDEREWVAKDLDRGELSPRILAHLDNKDNIHLRRFVDLAGNDIETVYLHAKRRPSRL